MLKNSNVNDILRATGNQIINLGKNPIFKILIFYMIAKKKKNPLWNICLWMIFKACGKLKNVNNKKIIIFFLNPILHDQKGR